MRRVIWIIMLAGIFLSAHLQADVSAGLAAYQRGDYLGARAEFEADARAGNPEAQYLLGQMYAQGRGTLQNFVAAHKWYNLSAAGGYREAANARDALERKMTPAQISEAQQQAAAFSTGGGVQAVATTPSRETVRAIQSELNRLGYGVGTPDGLAGPRTRDAIREFQRSKGLSETGQPGDQLLLRLRRTAGGQVSAKASADDDSAAMIAELEQVIDEGEKRRQAQASFISRLRAVLRRHAWPWKHEVFSDDFSDGDYTRGVRWQVASGRFSAGMGHGLKSSVQVSAGASAEGGEKFGKVLLKAFISEMAGSGAQSADPAAPAEIYTAQTIEPAFAVRLELGPGSAPVHWEIGPYQGADRSGGYRLQQQDGSLRLLRSSARGSSVVEMAAGVVLADEARHVLQWTRDAGGQMQVSVDGSVVLEARDRGVSGRFDGLVVVNRDGELALRSITVLDAR